MEIDDRRNRIGRFRFARAGRLRGGVSPERALGEKAQFAG